MNNKGKKIVCIYVALMGLVFAGSSPVTPTPTNPPTNPPQKNNPQGGAAASATTAPTFYTKTLGKWILNQMTAMDSSLGAQVQSVNSSWRQAYQLVMQNINSLSVNDPSYGAYVETAYNMLTLIPSLINTGGNYQPYNSTWSLIQGKDGNLYNVDGSVATNVARTMTAAQVSEITNKMVNMNVNYGQALQQIDPTLGQSIWQIYTILTNQATKPTDPFYSDYAEIALNQVNSVKAIVQGNLRPGNVRWGHLVDANGNQYNWDGSPRQASQQSQGKQFLNQIILMDLTVGAQVNTTNATWRATYYKTYLVLKTLPESDPFYNVYMTIAQNQLTAIPLLLKNPQFQPADVMWSQLKDNSNNLYDLTLTKQPAPASDKINTVKTLMNKIIQLDMDYSARVLTINSGWRDAYTGIYSLLGQWLQNATASGYQDAFVDTYIQAAQNQLIAIPILVQAGGTLYPTPQNFTWAQFQDSRGGTYDIQTLQRMQS
ncbi:MAG: hypothetical protein NEHIOOID_00149 [Holosporales bacterium]